jgi:hypothetical protein
MTPARRLTLKRSTGWLAAGQEMAAALDLLSDAAFKLYVYLCLNVDRHSGRMIWEALDLANRLQRDRESMALALEELCRLQVCIQHPAADGRIARERLSLEICDGFWPYEKAPVQEFGIDQNRYVQQVRQMMLRPVCVRAHFSAADERIAVALYRRGITLVHLQRAIWLGCARKYAALLNGSEQQAPLYITSLHYFAGIVQEVEAVPVGVDYWKHIAAKVDRFEQMWIELSVLENATSKSERRETK